MLRSLVPWLAAASIVAADRWTKLLLVEHLEVGGTRPVLPWLTLTHVHNPGIAFSLFADGGPLSRMLLHGIILLAVVAIAWLLARHGPRQLEAGLAFGLILGGAIGNLIDRVLYGWVIDFVHLSVTVGARRWSWPDFNVADSAITVGAVLLVASELLSKRRKTPDAPDAD